MAKQHPDDAHARRGGRGRPSDPGKAQAVLDAASHLFLANGFAATSMDAVAARAGVSKLTVYNRFGSKATLFQRVIETKCQQMLGSLDGLPIDRADARQVLNAVGQAFVELVTGDAAMAAHRLVVQERHRAPELGQLFFESAIMNCAGRVARVIDRLVVQGDIAVDDPVQAARDIMTMWRAEPVALAELGVGRLTDADLHRHVARITELFLKLWRQQGASIPDRSA